MNVGNFMVISSVLCACRNPAHVCDFSGCQDVHPAVVEVIQSEMMLLRWWLKHFSICCHTFPV